MPQLCARVFYGVGVVFSLIDSLAFILIMFFPILSQSS